MTKRPAAVALILLLVALISPASGVDVIVDEVITDYTDTSNSYIYPGKLGQTKRVTITSFYIKESALCNGLGYVVFEWQKGDHDAMATGIWLNGSPIKEGRYDIEYSIDGLSYPGVLYYATPTDLLGQIKSYRYTLFLNDWNGTYSGPKTVELPFSMGRNTISNGVHETNETHNIRPQFSLRGPAVAVSYATWVEWKNRIVIEKDLYGYEIELFRTIEGIPYKSTIQFTKNGEDIYTYTKTGEYSIYAYPYDHIDEINVIAPSGRSFVYPLVDAGGPDPGDPTVFRTGSVTMTDHNGTSITGFEVKAVNYYTGEEYTVSTDTDVAVITLPMDRTTEIRNPQTGVYEEAPVGYYTFYGQKPGYKMLHEDGIRVMVMPEKYGSYKLCDILVSSESGPLTGKHQFQLRSWSDNSILQTGTISAKSRTTGIWYNTTVTNGIATLILPYDTSDALSEYAGHYYVYATSPGYEDIDYGVQIAVYPRTVSEVRSIHLYPIGGVPTPGNVTLRIQTISETGQGVANAEIFIAGVLGAGKDVWDTYTASSTGYLTVSVPGNSTYDIVASGDGYYDSARRIEVFTEDPGLIELKLYLSGYPTLEPTLEPTIQPTGWPTDPPPTQPTGGIPDEDDDSDGFLVQAVRGIGLAFGVGFSTAKIIFGMLLALSIGFTTAKKLRGGAAEFGIGLLGGTMLGVLIGLLPVWIVVVLLLVVGLYVGNRYVGGSNNG